MEKKEAEADVEEQTRIHVGGLGEKVTDDDLSKIFSSLGEVKAVDIVRAKGRSFAYVDFFPSSHKSLSKLFSTYNGCVWKGGRLRLERAKEHYLARLKREWAEDDAQLVSPPVTDSVEADDKDATRLEMPKKFLDKDKKLNIFFPRLRKVKTLPFCGTGKHKYSFQRVEAPPLPKYFCDCEEHSAVFHAAEGKQIHHRTAGEEEIHDMEALGASVINEEELSLMNSVMNKLFEGENVSNAGFSGTGPANDEHNSDNLIGDLQIGEDEVDSGAGEDNLVINVVSRGNNRMALSRCQEKTTISPTNKKLTLSEAWTSKDRSAESLPKEQKKHNLPTNKKRKSLHSDEIRMASNPLDDMNLQTNTNKPSTPLAAQHAETESGVRKSTASHSWSQKMSWKALVGDKDSRAFSVSNILPSDASPEEADNSIDSFEELKFDENESGEDNLIINVVSKKKTKMAFSSSQKRETTSTMNQKSVSNENTTTTEDRPIQQKKRPKKKRKSVIDEESDKNKSMHTVSETDGCVQIHTETQMPAGAQHVEPESGVKQPISDHSESKKPSQRVVVGGKGNDESSVSNIFPDNAAKEEQPVSDCRDVPLGSTDSKNQNTLARNENLEGKLAEAESVEVLAGAQHSKSNTAPNKSCKGSSWFQKSPWTQLVNENNSSFSITQISTGITFKKHEVSKTQVGKEVANPNDKKSSKSVSQAGSEPITCASTALEDGKKGEIVSQIIPEKNQPTVVGNNEASASIVANKYNSTPRQTTNVDGTIGETCSFMRSAASIKEWSNAKAALSGLQSHKRKNHEK